MGEVVSGASVDGREREAKTVAALSASCGVVLMTAS